MQRLLILLVFCVVVNTQTTHYFRHGEDVTLVCQTNNSKANVVWRLDHTIIADRKYNINPKLSCYKKYSVFSNDSFTSMLHINMAEDCVEGHYWCETTSVYREYQSFSMLLKKIELPNTLRITNSDSKQMIHSTESIALDLICTVISGVPKETLSWIFNDKVLVSDNTTDSLKITIIPDRTFDYRVYTCQAASRYLKKPLIRNITLNIDYIPKVSVSVHPNSTVHEGTVVAFECIHDVKFATSVIWSKDDEHIPYFRSSLEYIHNITRTDTGLYNCKIMKNENEGSGNVLLDILYPPDVFVIDYSNGTLFCNATGNPGIYKYSQWEHKSSTNKHIRYLDGRHNGLLLIPDLNGLPWFYKSGTYICSAENGITSNHRLYRTGSKHVEFEGKPECILNDFYGYGILGQNAEISIEVYSVPKYDDFQWKTSVGNITNSSTKYFIKVAQTRIETVRNYMHIQVARWKFSLKIHDLSRDDSEYYTLQVRNKNGNTFCGFRLKHTNILNKKSVLYFGILTLSFIILVTSVISNICIHLHCKKLSRVTLQTGINEVSEVNIEMTDINNGYHTINEEDIRQEDNEEESQADIQSTYNSSSDNSSDKSAESAANENVPMESNDYLNPYCTMIESTADVHNYESLSLEKFELNTSIADVILNTGIQRSYENLKF